MKSVALPRILRSILTYECCSGRNHLTTTTLCLTELLTWDLLLNLWKHTSLLLTIYDKLALAGSVLCLERYLPTLLHQTQSVLNSIGELQDAHRHTW